MNDKQQKLYQELLSMGYSDSSAKQKAIGTEEFSGIRQKSFASKYGDALKSTANTFLQGATAPFRAIADFPSDIKEAGTKISQQGKMRGDILAKTINNTDFNNTNDVFELAKESTGQLLGTAGDYLGGIIGLALKLPTTQKTEDKVSSVVSGLAKNVADMRIPNAGNKTIKDGALEIGKAWDELEKRDPKTARNYRLFGNVAQFATDVLLGGGGKKATEEVVNSAVKNIAKGADAIAETKISKPKIPESLKEIFTRKKNPVVIDDVEKNIANPKTGITAENAGLIDKTADYTQNVKKTLPQSPEDIATAADEGVLAKTLSGEGDILTRGEKISAIDLDSKIGNEILDASKKADLHPDNATAIDTAVKRAFEQIDAYKAKLKQTGKNIGEIKDSLLSKEIKSGTGSLAKMQDDFMLMLKKKGAELVDGQWKLRATSPITKGDLVEIDSLLRGLKEVSSDNKLKDVVNLIKKIDDSGIKFGEPSKVSQTLDSILKKTRSELAALRDANLTPAEAAEFNKFSNMKDFLDNFKDKESAVRLLLKRANSQYKGDIKAASKEIFKEVGGHRIDRIGEVLAAVLEGGASKSDKTLLKQMIGNEADVILGAINPKSIVGKAVGYAAKKTFGKNRLKELEKYINIDSSYAPDIRSTTSVFADDLQKALGLDILKEAKDAGFTKTANAIIINHSN